MPEGRDRIAATTLRDLVVCERLVHNERAGDPAARDPTSAFVEMLREQGLAHETAVLARLGDRVCDLRPTPIAERASATLRAMESDAAWILGGRLETDRTIGMPDLLHRDRRGWAAGDVKAGGAFEADGRRPLLEYAVQVGAYAAALRDLGIASGTQAFVIDGTGDMVWYDLAVPWGRDGRSLATIVAELIATAEGIADGTVTARAALSAACKMCRWRSACTAELVAARDLTLVAALGRALRTAIEPVAADIDALAALDLATVALPGGRTAVAGVGAARLARFRDKARLLVSPGAFPYALRPLGLLRSAREFHLDIESVPEAGGPHVYLHGILERTNDDADDRFHAFLAEGSEGERDAFSRAVAFLQAAPNVPIYYYSRYERTCYRELQRRYPNVCAAGKIEALFDPARAVDLLSDVIMPSTEWPCRDLSIKTLAKFLGFSWRDPDASGAASIAWYRQWRRDGGVALLSRILDYNHDDVRASGVVLDGLIALPVRDGPPWPPVATSRHVAFDEGVQRG